MIVLKGASKGFLWEIRQSDATAYRSEVLVILRGGAPLHSSHVDHSRFLGNPRYVQDEIDRLIAVGILEPGLTGGNDRTIET
jgi:hypothetical protein